MAKGSIAKEAITQKILEVFEGAFVYGKEIRVPFNEEGNPVEIKLTLTCAKENVGGNSAFVVTESQASPAAPASIIAAPTEQEKANIANLMERLGL